ncbi:MAG: class I adenylate-forming enzyme family protein [Promethearchaeota archaeon]
MQFGVSESIEHWGLYRPDDVALLNNGNNISYGELNSRINQICNLLNEYNITGDRIAIAIENKLDFVITLIASLRIGKAVVVLNINLADASLIINIKDTQPQLLIHDFNSERITPIETDLRSFNPININRFNSNAGSTSSLYTPPNYRQADDEWGVVFSSGSTGIPKGIERNHDSIVTELLGWCLELNLNRSSTFYIGRPIYYTGGLVLTLSTLLVGGQVILNDYTSYNNAKEIWEDYQNTLLNNDISWAFFIPSQIRLFLNAVINTSKPLLKANSILLMGEPITGQEKLMAYNQLGSNIVESWGNSESLGTITEIDDLCKRPNSIGRPFLTDKMFIVDEKIKILPPNNIGRIAGCEEGGFKKYSNRSEDTKRVKQEGLIISDDLGYIDNDNYFYIKSRVQDSIVINGNTIFISDIESKIRENSSIKDCCILTDEVSDRNSIRLICVVALKKEASINNQNLLSELNQILRDDEKLYNITIHKELPYSSSGKIDKQCLKKKLNL